MILAPDFEDFIKLLNKHKVAYMVVGGYALAFHGKPRHTGDLDVWIKISDDNSNKMLKVLKEFGMGALGFEKKDFLKPGYITQIGYPPLRIDILNNIDGIEFDEAGKNMLQLDAEGFKINYIGLDDFLKNKKASGRSQDLADIQELKKSKIAKPKNKKSK
ncbi:nucleotidyltransferase [Chitinophaga varians]|uniref:nucleotidyltransferase n=1 Tax=Chitinophaga varians TaxID=2202339 RepID=UPI00165EC60B|nr:nucleotidyltransferase [Chitinophaga varians]MBC9909370.1 nucleotidyltransferase [Chitinophaga varians]